MGLLYLSKYQRIKNVTLSKWTFLPCNPLFMNVMNHHAPVDINYPSWPYISIYQHLAINCIKTSFVKEICLMFVLSSHCHEFHLLIISCTKNALRVALMHLFVIVLYLCSFILVLRGVCLCVVYRFSLWHLVSSRCFGFLKSQRLVGGLIGQ